MPILSNPKHEQFAQAVSAGEAASRAYSSIYGVPIKQAEASGARLLGNAKVSERVAEIRKKAEAESLKETMLTIKAKREFCAAVVRANAAELDESSPLVQFFKMTKHGREIRLCDKLKAIELDSKLAGHFDPHASDEPPVITVTIGGESQEPHVLG